MSNTEKEPKTGEERLQRLVSWYERHQRVLTIVGVLAVVAALGIWFTVTARQRRENFAARELMQARAAADAGNLPLAANDLSRLISTYGGTPAAEEGTVLLAQIQLQQEQPELAAATLRSFLNAGPRARYRAPANALLGSALEQGGNLAEAAAAYEAGGRAAQYELLGVQLLMEAGRAYVMAGDTGQAARVYEGILRDHPESPGLAEVRLRLGELRRSDIPS